MTSPDQWELLIAKPAQKQLDRVPKKDYEYLWAALNAMRLDLWSGDIARLKGQRFGWRRRVGNWRILYDLDPERRCVTVQAVERRTSTTY